ncbi:hypothetical protein FGB62_53g113 [Gracilaria domingensis]|nr:hypothetical protein FGB62_53g113 [Gracilaria domingensis]
MNSSAKRRGFYLKVARQDDVGLQKRKVEPVGSRCHEQRGQAEHVHDGFKAEHEGNRARGINKLAKNVEEEDDGDAFLADEERWIDVAGHAKGKAPADAAEEGALNLAAEPRTLETEAETVEDKVKRRLDVHGDGVRVGEGGGQHKEGNVKVAAA